MSVLWSENGQSWERKQKPGMFVSGKELLIFFGRVLLVALAGYLFVVLWMSL